MPRKENKNKVYQKFQEFIPKFKNIIVSDIKDLPADVVHKIRHEFIQLGQTECLGGKASVMAKAIHDYLEENKPLPKGCSKKTFEELADTMVHVQILVIFSNKELGDITNIVSKYIIPKQAKPGQHSPIEIIIPAGPTGMDSSQIELFQALKIPTKVARNQLEITSATKILSVGQKITLTEINLMKKFNIKPYNHMVKIKKIILNGNLYGEEILKITDDYMKKKLEDGIKNVLGFSLGSGVIIPESAPHSVMNAFRNICAFSLGTGVETQYTKAAAAAPKKEEPKQDKKKEEPKEEKKKEEPKEEDDEDVDFDGLF